MDLIFLFFCIAFFYIRGILKEKKRAARQPPSNSHSSINTPLTPTYQQNAIFEWPPHGNYDFEIVGESNYQNALLNIAKTQNGNDLSAILIPEDTNKYDPQAVRVEINNATVGYLSKDEARAFRRCLKQKMIPGQMTKARAAIVGGHEKNGIKMSYGVVLDLKPYS